MGFPVAFRVLWNWVLYNDYFNPHPDFESSKYSFTAANRQTDPKKDAKRASKFKRFPHYILPSLPREFLHLLFKKGYWLLIVQKFKFRFPSLAFMVFFLKPGCIEGTQTVPNRNAPRLAICEATRRVATYWPPKKIRNVDGSDVNRYGGNLSLKIW